MLPAGLYAKLFTPCAAGGRSELCCGIIRTLLRAGFDPVATAKALALAWGSAQGQAGPLGHYKSIEHLVKDVARLVGKPPEPRPGQAPGGEPQRVPPSAAARTYPEAPSGYENTATGLWRKAQPGVPAVQVASSPMEIVSISQVEGGSEHVAEVVQYSPHREKRHVFSMRDLSGRSAKSELMARGFSVGAQAAIHAWVDASVKYLDQKSAFATSFARYGWKEDGSFLLGYGFYRDRTRVLREPPPSMQLSAKKFRTAGTVEHWQAAANVLLRRGAEAQGFTLMLAFGAILMPFLSSEGGVIMSLVSKGTGTGKSTALSAAKSIWGDMDACALGAVDTQNHLFHRIGVLHNLPVVAEEFSFGATPDAAAAMIRIFTDGRERGRLNSAGEVAREPHTWSTAFITSSNISVQDSALASATGRAMASRVLEVPLLKRHQTTPIIRSFETNFGWAGPKFLRLLFDRGIDRVRAEVAEIHDKLLEAKQWGSEYRFYARAIAVATYAARLLSAAKFLDVKPHEILKFGVDCAERVCRSIDEQGESTLGILGRYINENARGFVVVEGGQATFFDKTSIGNKIVGRYERANKVLYLAQTELTRWMHLQGISQQELQLDLEREKVLLGNKRRVSLGHGTSLPSVPVACIALNLKEAPTLALVRPEGGIAPVGPASNSNASRS